MGSGSGAGGVRYQGLVGRGSTGRVLYRGTNPATHPADALLVLPGPNLWLAHASAPAMALQGALLAPLRTPWLPALKYALLEPYGRDSALNILKLVLNPECHRKYVMRPGILPISKIRRKVTTLNFPDFHIGQPSLTRNKWSCFEATRGFTVKTAKCHQMCTGWVYRSVTARIT